MKLPLKTLFVILLLTAFSKRPRVGIWLVGDSTMAAKKPERDPESGWGEGLKSLVAEPSRVHNRAASGRSTRSFVQEGRWGAVVDSIQPGDYVVIQFGHNDEKPDPLLHTDPFTSYKEHLVKFVSETRAKGAIPVICSPIVRRHFDGSGNLMNTHGDYPRAAREAAADTKTAFVDMKDGTCDFIQKLGPERSKSLFVFCEPGQCPRRPRGVQDSTHLNHNGAVEVARLFIEGVRKACGPLAKELK